MIIADAAFKALKQLGRPATVKEIRQVCFNMGFLKKGQATNLDGVRKKIADRAINTGIKDKPNKPMLFYRVSPGVFGLIDNHIQNPELQKRSLVLKEVISRKRRLNR